MFGTDGITANGTTGVHPKEVSQLQDGLGTKDTGIMVAMYLDITEVNGTDSKEVNGYTTTREFH